MATWWHCSKTNLLADPTVGCKADVGLWGTSSAHILVNTSCLPFIYRILLPASIKLLLQLLKVYSQEPTWRDLSALSYHYESQPVPTRVAWHLHRTLPAWAHQLCALVMFVVELGAP